MLKFRILIPLLLFVTAGITACHTDNDRRTNGNTETADTNKTIKKAVHENPETGRIRTGKDTADIRLALTPTLESLPFYYANHHKLFSKNGICVSVFSYTSQMDADTALLGQTADMETTDLIRVRYYNNKRKQPRLRPLFQTEGIWMLIAHNDARIHKMDALERKMLATARFSASDYYSTQALQSTHIPYDDVFRPQVNDYYIRLNMLSLHQIDAAILPEPFASSAISKGHNRLFTTADPKNRTLLLGCLAVREDWSRQGKGNQLIDAFTQSYNEAVREINAKGWEVCGDILVEDYHLDEETAKHLRLPKYRPATNVTMTAQEKADAYLNARGIRLQ